MRGRIWFIGLTISVLIILLALRTKKYPYGWHMTREYATHTEEGGVEFSQAFQGMSAGEKTLQDEVPYHIYLMVSRYSGQQGAGINAIASLQCWAGRLGLNISVVEPSIRNTTIIGIAKKDINSDMAMKLGDYFNIQLLNTASRKVGNAEIIAQEEFFTNPLNKVVYITTAKKESNYTVFWSSEDPANPCYQGSEYLDSAVVSLKKRGYCIVRVISIFWASLTRANLNYILGKYYNQNITLFFSKWMGPWSVHENSLSSRCNYKKARSWFLPSERLLKDAKRYEDTYVGSKYSLAIMIRVEHILILNRRKRKYTVPYCLQQVTSLVKELQRGKSKHTPMVAADIGLYGSNTFNFFIRDEHRVDNATNQVKNMLPVWLDHRLDYDSWESSFVKAANGVTNQAYIGALQRVIASRADCLLLAGGGTFQDLALIDYLRLHTDKKKWCIRFVCADRENFMKSTVQQADAGQLS